MANNNDDNKMSREEAGRKGGEKQAKTMIKNSTKRSVKRRRSYKPKP